MGIETFVFSRDAKMECAALRIAGPEGLGEVEDWGKMGSWTIFGEKIHQKLLAKMDRDVSDEREI